MGMIFAGIYSPKYEKSFNQMQEIFSKHNICSDFMFLDQSFFNRQLGSGTKCKWCKKTNCQFVFHWGETIKIQHMYDLCLKYQNDIIVYIDVDIKLIESKFDDLQSEIENKLKTFDIMFQAENDKANSRWKSNINIGFNAFIANEKSINFFLSVLEIMTDCDNLSNQNSWDQQVVNNIFFNNQTNMKHTFIKNGLFFNHCFGSDKSMII